MLPVGRGVRDFCSFGRGKGHDDVSTIITAEHNFENYSPVLQVIPKA